MFKKITIIGLGLIGSSICLAVKSRGLADEIVGCDLSKSVLDTASKLSLADHFFEDPSKAVQDSDLIILSVPVGSIPQVGKSILNFLKPGCILTDTGSVKNSVVSGLKSYIPEEINFIPSHPVAGTENSGPESGFAELFEGRWCILTPNKNINKKYINILTEFWERIGSLVEIMSPENHDLILAITSHLPHLIAYNIVGTADDLEQVTQSDVVKFAAGGFRDFTRIASSNPIMWRDVFLNNKEAVLEMLGRFNEDLTELQKAIRWNDGEKLEKVFRKRSLIRKQIIEAGQAEFEESKKIK